MTIVGTRPEIIRLSRIIPLLDKHCDHILVHTGQNFDVELNDVFFSELNIRAPDLNLQTARKTAAETIANIIEKSDVAFLSHKPDAVLILGDTNSALAAISAKRRKIPVFHIEAGNRCFDQRVPEEINRRIVDHIADINMTYTSIAREYLIREGLPPDQIIKIGSPMYEVLNHYKSQIEASRILEKLALQSYRYYVVSAHREENIESDQQLNKLIFLLNTLANEHKTPVIVSTHPRTRKRLDALRASFHTNVRLLKPLGFLDYVFLQMNSKAVLSDSGTITEESSILDFPALNIREAHERPEGMEEGSVIMVGLELERILQALKIIARDSKSNGRVMPLVKDYEAPNLSEKVLRVIYSYTDYVNRVVWKKLPRSDPSSTL